MVSFILITVFVDQTELSQIILYHYHSKANRDSMNSFLVTYNFQPCLISQNADYIGLHEITSKMLTIHSAIDMLVPMFLWKPWFPC